MATCNYNGITFTSLYKSKISSKPVLDEAQRTVVHVEHSLEITGYVLPNVVTGVTDTPMSSIRKLLTAPGGALYYSDKGFGELNVNTEAAGVRDVAWGPRPEILEWAPLGGDGLGACRVVWRVTTRIPECTSAVYTKGLAAWNSEESFEIDEAGYTIVRYSGYLEIPMTRRTQGDRTLPDHVDLYRSRLESAPPPGFIRRSASFRISKDKRRLDFDVTNEEVPEALPSGVAAIDARHTVESTAKDAFRRWMINFDATITMPRGASRSQAMVKFLDLLQVRLASTARRIGGELRLFPQRIFIEDDLFGRGSRFAWSGFFFNTGPIWTFIAGASQLWKPLGTDYRQWTASLVPYRTHSVRGWAGLGSQPSDDAIVDLCVREQTIEHVGIAKKIDNSGDPGEQKGDKFDHDILRGLGPVNSWMGYEIKLRYEERSNAVRHKLLLPAGDSAARQPALADARPGAQYVGKWDPIDDDNIRRQTGPGITPAEGQGTRPPDPIQRPTTPTRVLILTGFGVRLGYRVPVPTLRTVGGVEPVEFSRIIEESSQSAYRGIPIYRTDWRIEYLLPSAPTGPIALPGNPTLAVDGTDGVNGKITL